jgi:hypothetical protein
MGLGSPEDLAEPDLCRVRQGYKGVSHYESGNATNPRCRLGVATLAG